MNEKLKDPSLSNKTIGYLFILSGLSVFLIFTIWIVLAKFIKSDNILGESNNGNETSRELMNFMKKDEIYCVSIPIFFPVLVIFAYCRWTAFSYFKYCD